jgi:hypothetical protein
MARRLVSSRVPVAEEPIDAPGDSIIGADADLLPALTGWETMLPELRVRYADADPYPHIVLDDVLPCDVYARAAGEFGIAPDESWTNYLHVNEKKFGNQRPDTWGPTLQAVARAFTGVRFIRFLERLTDIDGLLADRTMDGGGLHQTPRGGFLNVHADFTAHHTVHNWRRRVNVLLYLNDHWDPEWGGDLELWDRDMSRAVVKIRPVGNRMVVFSTDEHSFHGHPDPLRCPDGVLRKSLALYYFTAEARPMVRATNYQPRPGDGFKRVAIHLDKGALRAYDAMKRRWRLSDAMVSRLLRRGR